MNTLKNALSLLALVCFTATIKAQNTDVGLHLGGSYYFGDVVNSLDLGAISYSAGGFVRYRITERIAARVNGMVVHIKGDDANSASKWQNTRNWNFQTQIIEGSLVGEFNFKDDRNKGRKFANPMIPYAYLGIGFISFKPQTDFNGTMVETQPLQLSGVNYGTTALVVPFGVGFRYYVAKSFQLGFDIGLRYCLTSYIDDIGGTDVYVDPATTPNPAATSAIYARSTSDKNPGDPRGKMGLDATFGSAVLKNDIYFAYGLTAAYTLPSLKGGGGAKSRGGSYGGKAIKCPRFY